MVLRGWGLRREGEVGEQEQTQPQEFVRLRLAGGLRPITSVRLCNCNGLRTRTETFSPKPKKDKGVR